MRSLTTRTLSLIVLLLLAVAACGTDETTEQTPGDEPTTTEPSPAAPGGATGTGLVTIAGTELPFTATTCALEDDGSVTIEGAGETDALSYQVTVSRTVPDGINRESVRVVFSPQELSTLTNLYTDESGSPRFDVGESVLTGSGEFLSAGGAPAGEGTVEVTCGATPE